MFGDLTCYITAFPGCGRPLFYFPGLPPLSIGAFLGALPFLGVAGLELRHLFKRDDSPARASQLGHGGSGPKTAAGRLFGIASLGRRILGESWGPVLVGMLVEAPLTFARVKLEAAQLGSALPLWLSFLATWALSGGIMLLVTALTWFLHRWLKAVQVIWASADSPKQVMDTIQRLLGGAGTLTARWFERLSLKVGRLHEGAARGMKRANEDLGTAFEEAKRHERSKRR
jgi:hypothetical protein